MAALTLFSFTPLSVQEQRRKFLKHHEHVLRSSLAPRRSIPAICDAEAIFMGVDFHHIINRRCPRRRAQANPVERHSSNLT